MFPHLCLLEIVCKKDGSAFLLEDKIISFYMYNRLFFRWLGSKEGMLHYYNSLILMGYLKTRDRDINFVYNKHILFEML